MNKREIKQLRETLKLDKYEFAAKVGVRMITVHRWEKGQAPRWSALKKLEKMKRDLEATLRPKDATPLPEETKD